MNEKEYRERITDLELQVQKWRRLSDEAHLSLGRVVTHAILGRPLKSFDDLWALGQEYK